MAAQPTTKERFVPQVTKTMARSLLDTQVNQRFDLSHPVGPPESSKSGTS